MKSKIKINNLKGTEDFLPEEQLIRNHLINVLKDNFERFGYLPLETPILNYYSLLAYKYNEDAEILNETYKLTDQGNRDIGLRYDLTIPFCKVIAISKSLAMPFRRYEIGKVFRNGPVKAGRCREFYQCDIDVVGINGRYVEIEQMLLVINTFKAINIDINIKWNNRKLMTGILTEENINIDNQTSVIGIIDRLDKISKEELLIEFEKINIDKNKMIKLLELFDKTILEYNEMFKNTNNQLVIEGLSEVNEFQNLIKELEINSFMSFSPTLARGLNIYTGIVYEFYDKKMRISSSLGSGGRYDKIITEFINDGNIYPAVGLSFGLEPIYHILKEEKINKNNTKAYIVPLKTELESLKIASKLREAGINVLVETTEQKLKKSFEYADRNSIEFTIIVGEDEIKENLYTVKNMVTKEQGKYSIEEIIGLIKNS